MPPHFSFPARFPRAVLGNTCMVRALYISQKAEFSPGSRASLPQLVTGAGAEGKSFSWLLVKRFQLKIKFPYEK